MMAELQTREHELTTADLAGHVATQSRPDGPKVVNGQHPETPPLFSESEMGEFRSRWSTVQTGFVDEPRRTVEDADKLVAAVMLSVRDISGSGCVFTIDLPRRAIEPSSSVMI